LFGFADLVKLSCYYTTDLTASFSFSHNVQITQLQMDFLFLADGFPRREHSLSTYSQSDICVKRALIVWLISLCVVGCAELASEIPGFPRDSVRICQRSASVPCRKVELICLMICSIAPPPPCTAAA